MSVFDNPGGNLYWLEDELLEEELEEEETEEEEEVESPRRRRSRKARWEESSSMADREAIYIEKKKREKGIRRLKFLAFLEILAILLVLWWWIKWLY